MNNQIKIFPITLIGISGYAGSGKDTIATMIQYLICKPGKPSIEQVITDPLSNQWWLEDGSKWQIKKFSKKLKTMAAILLSLDDENIFENQKFKDSILPTEWNIHGMPMSIRSFLQKLGTDSIRNGLHDNAWVNATFADYKTESIGKYGDNYPNWILTDTRFPNEAKAIKDKGGIIIRIDRPGCKLTNPHPSETALDDWKFDYKIANVSDLTSLMFTVQNILKHAKIPFNHGPTQ